MLRWLRSNLKLYQVLSYFRVDQPPHLHVRTEHNIVKELLQMCVIVSVGSMPLPRPWGIWSVYRIIRITRVFTEREKEVEPNYSRRRGPVSSAAVLLRQTKTLRLSVRGTQGWIFTATTAP